MNRNKKRLSLFILILCIFTVMRFNLNFFGDDFKVVQKIPFNQNNNFEYRAKTHTLKHGYLVVDPTEVTYISAEGLPIWKKSFSSQNVGSAVGSRFMVLCENKAGDVYVLDDKGTIIAEVLGLGAIEEIKVLNDEYVAILFRNRDLKLFTKNLEPVSVTVLPKGKLIDFGLTPNSSELVVGILDLTRRAFNTKLVFIDRMGNITSGSHIYESIAYHIELKANEIIMVVDSGFLFYNYKGALQNTVELDRSISRFLFHENNEEIWVFLVNELPDLENPKPPFEVVVFNEKGSLVHSFIPPFENINGMVPFGEDTILFNEKELAIVSKEGKLLKRYVLNDDIVTVHTVDSNSFGVEFINRLDIYIRK